ncbi:MAG: PstS family phosphate ABC transporter substrate-binding protein [Candidatus Brocadiia bacterium]
MLNRIKLVGLPLLALAVCAVLLLPAAPGVHAQMQRATIACDGSTTVGPIAKAFAEYYMDRNPDVNVTVSETGSGDGARALISGSCDIADMSRFMKEKEFTAAVENGVYPVAHAVAMDGIAIVVHPSNPIDGLTVEQVRAVYQGTITNWSELGGPNRPIVKISRDTSSGTYETFYKLVMQKEDIVGAEYVQSNGAARARVSNTPAAIGYVGLGFAEGVKALRINGVEPTPITVATGTYPVSRPLFMVTDGYPKLGSHVHRFITLYLTRDGQSIIEDIGFVPVTRY